MSALVFSPTAHHWCSCGRAARWKLAICGWAAGHYCTTCRNRWTEQWKDARDGRG